MEIKRVSIYPKSFEEDILGRKLSRQLQEAFNHKDVKVRTARTYLFQGEGIAQNIESLVEMVMLDPVISDYIIGGLPPFHFDYLLDISYKAGVTDNVVRSLVRGLEFELGRSLEEEKIQSAAFYFISGLKDEKALKAYAEKHLCNPLVEDLVVLPKELLSKGRSNVMKEVPKEEFKLFEYFNLHQSDEDLVKLSQEALLFLNLQELKAIQKYFDPRSSVEKEADVEEADDIRLSETRQEMSSRYGDSKRFSDFEERKKAGLEAKPTDVEMEILAQTWSEHCKHKIFAATVEYEEGGRFEAIKSLYKTFIKDSTKKLMERRKELLSVFTDNAGVFQIDKQYAVALKVETHNSPSALDPYGGAMTGIVGVNRDILGTGLGAKPIFNTDVFCFGPPDYAGELFPKMHHPKTIFKGVHRGVKEGGNESGIPTVNGAMVFHESFIGKPLVFCGTGGILPLKIKGRDGYKKYLQKGDRIVVAGGGVGKDGIHGATFSSGALTETSPTAAVQIGDPMTQKRLSDFLLEARDRGLYNSITDNGAGGVSSSVGEMAQETGGASVHLDRVVLKYPGLKPWQIMISESQERMTFGVPKESLDDFLSLAKRYGVLAYEIGEFNDSGLLEVFYQDQIVARLSMDFLHHGLPTMTLKARWSLPKFEEPSKLIFQKLSPNELLLKILARPNIASKERWVREYDHEVKGQSVVKPFEGVDKDGPSDGGVLRPLVSKISLGVACGINPFYGQIDPYWMAASCLDEAMRNLVCLGVNPEKTYCLDNFCWPDPIESPSNQDGPYKLGQLVRANKALKDFTLIYDMPLISGKDSMKNDYLHQDKKISVLPTLLITATGIVEATNDVHTSFFKSEGSLVYLLGETKEEMGGSELYRAFGFIGNGVPKVDGKLNKKLYQTFYEFSKAKFDNHSRRNVLAVHDLSEGGLIVALAEMCIGGNMGVDADFGFNVLDPIALFYSESQGRLLVEIDPETQAFFEEFFQDFSYRLLGRTGGDGLRVSFQGKNYVDVAVEDLKKSFKETLNFE